MKYKVDNELINSLGYFYIEKHTNNGYLLYDKDDEFIGVTYLKGKLFQYCNEYYISTNRDKLINDILNNK